MKKAAILALGAVGIGIALLASSKPAGAAEREKTKTDPSGPPPDSVSDEAKAIALAKKALNADSSHRTALITEAMRYALKTGNAAAIRRILAILWPMDGVEGLDIAGLTRIADAVAAKFGGQATPEQMLELLNGRARANQQTHAGTPTAKASGAGLAKASAAPAKASAAPAKASAAPAKALPAPAKVTSSIFDTPAPKSGPSTSDAKSRDLAAALVQHLERNKKGHEDRVLVGRFQEAEGIKQDGEYGPRTATELVDYGLVPPLPYYWPKNWLQAKKDYSAVLRQAASKFPSLAEQYRAASKAVERSI